MVKKDDDIGPITIPRANVELLYITIRGISPLIVHRWSRKAMQIILDGQQKKPHKTRAVRDPDDDYEQSRYVSTEGWDGVQAVSFKAALVGACRQISGLPMTLAKRTLFIRAQGYTDDGIELVRIIGEPKKRTDMVRVKNGSADIRFRAQYWPWSVQLGIEFNAGKFSIEQVANLLSLAGRFEGIGEWRPSCPLSATGTLGRWELLEN